MILSRSPITAATRSASRPVVRAETPTSRIAALLTQSHPRRRDLSSSPRMDAKFAPAKRVAGQKQDVWSIVNEAAAASPVQPIVNMGQGFL